MKLTMHTVELGLRRRLSGARELVRTEAAAVALARHLLQADPEGTAEFDGDALNLAGYLRHLGAHGCVDLSALAVPDPDLTPLWRASWHRSAELRDEFHGDLDSYLAWCRNEHRHGREVPDVAAAEQQAVKATSSTKVTPAPAPAPAPRAAAPAPTAAPAVALAHQKKQVRLSLAAAGAKLGVPLERLRLTHGVLEALRDVGLGPVVVGRTLELDGEAVARLAADRAALERLDVRLAAAVPSLGHVGSGHEIHIA